LLEHEVYFYNQDNKQRALKQKSEQLHSRGWFRLGGKEPDESPLPAMLGVMRCVMRVKYWEISRTAEQLFPHPTLSKAPGSRCAAISHQFYLQWFGCLKTQMLAGHPATR